MLYIKGIILIIIVSFFLCVSIKSGYKERRRDIVFYSIMLIFIIFILIVCALFGNIVIYF